MPRFVVEHKSTSDKITPGSIYWKKLLLDAQIDFYLPGAETLGRDCDGVLYDVLGKPHIQPLKATPVEKREYRKDGKLYARCREFDETPDEFEKRCLEKLCEDPERYYQRATIVRLDKEREEAAFDVWQTAGAIRDAKRLRVFPRNTDACVQWGRACDFFEVCCNIRDIGDPVYYRQQEFEHTELGARGEGLLTQSAIRCYRSCPRKYYYRYVKRMRSVSDEAAPLRIGTLLHASLEVWWKTGGDLASSLKALDVAQDPFERAKMRAMIIGYHARWEKPPPCEHVELFIKTPLINPETGAPSRTFELGMKLDVLCDLDKALTMPIGDPQSLEQTLEASLKELE
jgi:hypothetical protein